MIIQNIIGYICDGIWKSTEGNTITFSSIDFKSTEKIILYRGSGQLRVDT